MKYIKKKKKEKTDKSVSSIEMLMSIVEISRCQKQFWALLVIEAAYQWLHLTGEVWLPISVL